MRVLYNNDIQNISNQLKDTVVGLGNFDGLHIGHAELINNLISSAKVNGYTSVIYSFNNNSKNITNRRIKTPMITINKQKIEYLNDTGLDYLILDDFNDEFSKMSAEEFVKKNTSEHITCKNSYSRIQL